MALRPQNFEMVAGDGKILTFPVTDEADQPADITAATELRFVIAARTPVVKTKGDGVAVEADGQGGSTVEVTLAGEDTAGLVGVFAMQLQIVHANVPSVLQVGDLTLHPRL